jgi:NAD(P)H-flavin reductase
MLVQAANEKLRHRLFLFYSNRRPEDTPFLEELQALEQENPHYTLIPSMSEMATSHRPWNGETGLIDQAMLSRHLSDAVSPIYYVAGPPEMVKGLHEMLKTRRRVLRLLKDTFTYFLAGDQTCGTRMSATGRSIRRKARSSRLSAI